MIAAALKHMFLAGMSQEAIVAAVEDMEASRREAEIIAFPTEADISPAAVRMRRYRERNRSVTSVTEASPSVTEGVTGSPHTPLDNIKKIKQTTPTNPKALRKPTGEPRFDEFWSVYPRKIARGAALKTWRAAVSRGVDPEQIIAGAKLYAKIMRGTEPVYIKYPQGWLSGERWGDEPDKPAATVLAGPWKPFKPEAAMNGHAITDDERQANLAKLARIGLKVDRPCDTESPYG